MFTDMTKMFDPQAISQQWQKYMDMNQAISSSKTSMDAWQQMSGIWAKTFTTVYEKQMKMCQNAMQDSIECVRDMSTAKGIEDMMAKQAEWTRKCAESCQSSAQELATTLQKTQTQCTDMVSKLMTSSFENQTKQGKTN